jgi:hypothetical protein
MESRDRVRDGDNRRLDAACHGDESATCECSDGVRAQDVIDEGDLVQVADLFKDDFLRRGIQEERGNVLA